MKFTLVLPLNRNSSVASNRGVFRLQTATVLEPGCCRARRATTRFWSRQFETVWRLRSCSSSVCFLCPSLCNDRCPVSCGQSTGAFLGPVVYARLDAETRGDSTGAFLGQGLHTVPFAMQIVALCHRFWGNHGSVQLECRPHCPGFLEPSTTVSRWLALISG